MARPRKEGLGYFPLDTTFNESMEGYIELEGNDGFSFMMRFWMAAYQKPDGRLDLSEVLRRRMFAKRCRISEERLEELIHSAGALDLVDANLWITSKTLTSNGIQKRISAVLEQREKARLRADRGSSAKNPRRTPEELAKNGGKGNGKGNSLERESAGARGDCEQSRAPLEPPPTLHPMRRLFNPASANQKPARAADVVTSITSRANQK